MIYAVSVSNYDSNDGTGLDGFGVHIRRDVESTIALVGELLEETADAFGCGRFRMEDRVIVNGDGEIVENGVPVFDRSLRDRIRDRLAMNTESVYLPFILTFSPADGIEQCYEIAATTDVDAHIPAPGRSLFAVTSACVENDDATMIESSTDLFTGRMDAVNFAKADILDALALSDGVDYADVDRERYYAIVARLRDRGKVAVRLNHVSRSWAIECRAVESGISFNEPKEWKDEEKEDC